MEDVISPDGLEQQIEAPPQPRDSLLWGLSQAVVARIYESVGVPTSLYHYTSSAGLIGIITEHKLWFSDATFMNDGSESTYGVRLASLCIDEFLQGKPQEELDAGERLKTEIADATRHFQQIIFCLSARNNLLNQWRDYGKDVVPYCIEFDARGLEQWKKDTDFTFPIFITKVVYDVHMQRDLMIDLLSRIYEKAKIALGDRQYFEENEAQKLLMAAAVEIVALITRFKNPAFEAEEEWRAVAYRPEIEASVTRKYRSSSLGAVPYYEWHQKGEVRSLPILSVTVGPSPYAQVSDLALKQLLGDNGYNVPTHYSLIPIRR